MRLIDKHMTAISCQKLLLPTLTPSYLWRATNRLDAMQKELLTLVDRTGRHFVLAPTHEESITALMAELHPLSYRALPLKLYQMSTKFRDEADPKHGLIRSREFLMKDLYTFDVDKVAAMRTYEEVSDAYNGFFSELGVPVVRVRGDSGDIGGEVSHEFHYDCGGIGQDQLLLCAKCGRGENIAVVPDLGDCPRCGGRDKAISERKGVEVGHTFFLGDRYSAILKGQYLEATGKPAPLQMGCYGLGVSRILAAAVESLSTKNELRWPDKIAPFSAAVLAPKAGSREEAAIAGADIDFYDELNTRVFSEDVVLDDRDRLTVGKKLREAKATGYSCLVLFGKGCLQTPPKVEVHETATASEEWTMREMGLPEALSYLESKRSLS